MPSKLQLFLNTREDRCTIQSVISMFIMFLVLGIFYWTRESTRWFKNNRHSLSDCNLFSGKWIHDDRSYPLYPEQHCSFLYDGMACERAGRTDVNYQQWRWQPHQCNLPRFNAVAMLERLRGKRLLFVGDTIVRNQWASLVCLLDSSIPPAFKSVTTEGYLVIFKIKEYNASIEHYWAPFLVESTFYPMVHHIAKAGVVRVKAIEKQARNWSHADILIFDSHDWWSKQNFRVMWGSSGRPEEIHSIAERLRAYEMALETWIDWLSTHINGTRTRLFFVGKSPTHYRGEKWGKSRSSNCFGETEPILEEGYHEESESDNTLMKVMEAAIDEVRRRGLKIQFLNITQLSSYRKDAHTSIYHREPNGVTREQLANMSSYADCQHWCVPGVPDVWNELLYAYLVHFS